MVMDVDIVLAAPSLVLPFLLSPSSLPSSFFVDAETGYMAYKRGSRRRLTGRRQEKT